MFFSYQTGTFALSVLFSIVFLRYGGDNRSIGRVLSNKWLIFSILMIMTVSIVVDAFDSVRFYLDYFDFSRHQFDIDMQQFLASADMKKEIHIFELIILLSYILSLILFLVSMISKKCIGKFALIVIIISISLLVILLFKDAIDCIRMYHARYILLSFGLYDLVRICLILTLYKICNRESISNSNVKV